jgi:outer membrane protein assembly factor BamB
VRTVVTVGLILVGLGWATKYAFDHRTEYHSYHLALLKIRGDVASDRHLEKYDISFVSEAHVVFPPVEGPESMHPKWAFRLSHAVPTYPVPVVDDTDGDGVPEVFLASFSRELIVVDGRDGTELWRWSVPFGIIGAVAVAVADLDFDGAKEVVLGTHWSLPIRVYALDAARDVPEEERVIWTRNVSGDFIEAGLSLVKGIDQTYVAVATRDAPYSRGVFAVLDARGEFVYEPVAGIDVCMGRPAIGTLPASGRVVAVHGSHNWYGAEFGHAITARNVRTGELLWTTQMPGDTGAQLHQIADVNFDGRNEVVANVAVQSQYHCCDASFMLDGETGQIMEELPGQVFGILPDSRLLLLMNQEFLR